MVFMYHIMNGKCVWKSTYMHNFLRRINVSLWKSLDSKPAILRCHLVFNKLSTIEKTKGTKSIRFCYHHSPDQGWLEAFSSPIRFATLVGLHKWGEKLLCRGRQWQTTGLSLALTILSYSYKSLINWDKERKMKTKESWHRFKWTKQ